MCLTKIKLSCDNDGHLHLTCLTSSTGAAELSLAVDGAVKWILLRYFPQVRHLDVLKSLSER